MAVKHVTDVQEAADHVARLPVDAVLDNVLLTVLDTCLETPDSYPEHHWWFVDEEDSTVGVAFHTPPHPLGLGLQPGPWIDELAADLLESGHPVEQVSGLRPRTEAFVNAWTALTGTSTELVYGLRMLECLGLRAPQGVPGSARPVRDDEFDDYFPWVRAFMTELSLPDHDPESSTQASLEHAYWWLDADGQRVSIASGHAPSRGVSRVGPVYTPPGVRGRGYAGAVTAVVTQAFYDGGAERVILYTDAANPISNAVYERIGYVHVADGLHLRFVEKP